MPRFLYGGSYDALAAQEMNRDQARDSRYFNSLAQQRAVFDRMENQRQQEMENALRMQALARQAQMVQYNRAMQARQMGESSQLNWLDRLMAAQQWRQKFGLEQAKLAQDQGQQAYKEASGAVTEGLVDDSSIPQLFPQLSPLQQARLAAYRKNLGAQEQAEESSIGDMAQGVNEMILAQRRGKAETDLRAQQAARAKEWFTTARGAEKEFAPKIAAVAKMTAEQLPMLSPQEYQKLLTDLIIRQRLSDVLRPNPETQSVVPIQRPRTFAPRNPSGMTVVRSKAERDALPVGAQYVYNGKTYTRQ